jgi:predicted PurR-regulated permease PerM
MVLALLVILIVIAVPRVVEEGFVFARHTPDLLDTLARETKATAERYGVESTLAKYVHRTDEDAAEADPSASTTPAEHPATQAAPLDEGPAGPEQVNIEHLKLKIQELLLSFLPAEPSQTKANGEKATTPDKIVESVRSLVREVAAGTGRFLLAILLSFLIVLDYDRLKAELTQWRTSTVGQFFHEAASSVIEFSGVVGSAFQCQLVIATLNATVTCIGMFVLGIHPLLLLTTIVFLFGLIPVLGVFISSVPIILIAFNDYDLTRALLALGMIVVVHMLEAYVFNPRIYAARFHLNPVIVLIILLVGHELFGVWGMLLGIPVTHYVLNVAQMPAIHRKERRSKRVKNARGSAAPSQG